MMKFLDRYRGSLNKAYSAYVSWRLMRYSRRMANVFSRTISENKGFSSVDKNVKRQIKNYCKQKFGDVAFWPWLATYTEIRGEFIKGWVPNEYFLYKAIPKLNDVATSHISLYKTMDYRLFGDLCLRPELIIVNHLLYDSDFKLINKQQAYERLKAAGDEVVIKKDGSSGGFDVRFIRQTDIMLEELMGRGSFVIQPLVKQHHKMSEVFHGTINTLRVLSYIDSYSKVNILAVILVFGTNGLRVNNVARGGRSIYIGDDGKPLTDAYQVIDEVPVSEKLHPDTGFHYSQIQVPSLQKVKDFCTAAHYRYPFAGFVGWDVYIDIEGNPKLLEWNAKVPHFWINEASVGPFFDVDELKRRIGE